MSGAGQNFGKPARVTATANVKEGQGKLWKMLLVAGTDVATVAIYDSTTTAGDPIIELKAPANGVASIDLHEENGVPFDIALRAVLSGTSPALYLWHA